MAPIHHHYELSNWPETKIVVRFWIIGLLLALLSLTTSKLDERNQRNFSKEVFNKELQ